MRNKLEHSLCPLPLVLPLDTAEKSPVTFTWVLPIRYLHILIRCPLSLLKAEKTQVFFSAFFLTGDALDPSHFCGPVLRIESNSALLQVFSAKIPSRAAAKSNK